MPARASRPSAYAFRCTSSYLIERHSRSMKMLSMKRPRPSIEIATPAAASLPAKALADLGVKLGRLTLALLPAIARTARPAREQARRIVENLLLPGINLVRMHPVPLRQFRNRRILPQRLERNLRLERRIKLLA